MKYQPIGLKSCPTCNKSGLVNRKSSVTTSKYEPIGLKKCPTCNGSGLVDRTNTQGAKV